MFFQKTLAGEVHLHGIGLHTGCEINTTLTPAEVDSGITFTRLDLPGQPQVLASVENLGSLPQRTSLVKGEAVVQTIEHLLSCLYVLGIQNLNVALDGPEFPGFDGSALPIFEALRKAGVVEQKKKAREVSLRQPLAITDGNSSLIALRTTGPNLTVSYTLHYNSPYLEPQYFEIEVTEENFEREIAPARTFVLEEHVPMLRSMGLGKGANTQNTLVVGREGIIGNELRYKDEFVRHKILDLIGDLYLTGCRINARLLGTKSGHQLNVRMARLILDSTAREREVEEILMEADAGLDIRKITKVIPHRYPFLMIDRVLKVEGDQRAVGVKNVSINEPYFQGHFPGQPVMPGALQIEAMAQLAGLLLLRKPENADKLAYLLSLDKVKFRKTVIPGDQMILEAETRKMRAKTAQVETRALVDGKVVAEAVITFMIVDPY
ncbi:MAG: UDP-3-O-[3-hydroxymyristoyl] N-acetylglucosamine deacetylase [Planctomycetes bacterium]|nr:UDP-3-O-[3-hydroxymyristoyl] N-acetylglucosamine deacetylase [Planctomycetota bacterium]